MSSVKQMVVLVMSWLAFAMAMAKARDAALQPLAGRWPAEKAKAWYESLPWLVGCNFIPSSAINELEMWQADTFDPVTIDRELRWAEGLGFNTVRVFLHDQLWEADSAGLQKRIEQYLEIADRHHIRTTFVMLDDCWNDNAKPGKQPDPVPGVHNSGWMRSPGSKATVDPQQWPRLERYVSGILTAFGKDRRVLMWDMYNEPGNSGMAGKTLPLLGEVFNWGRAANPSQPLTAGVWFDNAELNEFQLASSDVITFHNYRDAGHLREQIASLKKLGRPVICTEYMARRENSRFETHLPVFKQEKVGCYNWGLVSGKTETIFPWGSPKGAAEPKVWFHDVLRRDGSAFDPDEVAVIRRLCAGATSQGGGTIGRE